MPTIVCFGDSNTWGCVPASDAERFPRDVRWPVRLQHALGDTFEVIAEGLNGRTAAIESPVEDGLNGATYFLPCLRSHKPVDLVIIYLGTNDVNFLRGDLVAQSVGRLVKLARTSETGQGRGAPEALVVCPPPFDGHVLGPFFAEECTALECELLDLDGIVSYSCDDSEHLDAEGHAAVAVALEERIRALL